MANKPPEFREMFAFRQSLPKYSFPTPEVGLRIAKQWVDSEETDINGTLSRFSEDYGQKVRRIRNSPEQLKHNFERRVLLGNTIVLEHGIGTTLELQAMLSFRLKNLAENERFHRFVALFDYGYGVNLLPVAYRDADIFLEQGEDGILRAINEHTEQNSSSDPSLTHQIELYLNLNKLVLEDAKLLRVQYRGGARFADSYLARAKQQLATGNPSMVFHPALMHEIVIEGLEFGVTLFNLIDPFRK